MSDFLNSVSGSASYYEERYSATTTELKDKLTNTDYASATDEELMEACKSFEQYFTEQAMKGMEKMIPNEEERESSSFAYVNMFKDDAYQKYASLASDRGDGIGIAKMLYEQMKRNYSTVTPTEIEEASETTMSNESNT